MAGQWTIPRPTHQLIDVPVDETVERASTRPCTGAAEDDDKRIGNRGNSLACHEESGYGRDQQELNYAGLAEG